MIQLIIFILNTTGKFLGKLISNRGCLVSFLIFCVVFFYIIGKGAQQRSYEIQKAHPELKKIKDTGTCSVITRRFKVNNEIILNKEKRTKSISSFEYLVVLGI